MDHESAIKYYHYYNGKLWQLAGCGLINPVCLMQQFAEVFSQRSEDALFVLSEGFLFLVRTGKPPRFLHFSDSSLDF